MRILLPPSTLVRFVVAVGVVEPDQPGGGGPGLGGPLAAAEQLRHG